MNELSSEETDHLWEVPGPSVEDRFINDLAHLEVEFCLAHERECLRSVKLVLKFIPVVILYAITVVWNMPPEIRPWTGGMFVLTILGLAWYGASQWREALNQRKRRFKVTKQFIDV